ncbi:MAK10-like protein [Tanacetum coccineum]
MLQIGKEHACIYFNSFHWEDFTTRFLAQFFPLGRTVKLRNDILMFQQHQGESLSEAWTRFKDLLQIHSLICIDFRFKVQIFYDYVNAVTRRTIDQSADGKLRDKNAKESWALLEDLALYDNESWNDPRDFTKQVKAISFAPRSPEERDSGKILEKAFVDLCVPRRFREAGKLQVAITDRITRTLPSNTIKNPKLNVNSTSPVLSTRFYPTEDPQCSTRIHSSINAITICPKQPNKSRDDKLEEEGREEKNNPENINTTLPLPPDPSISFITEKVRKLNSVLEFVRLDFMIVEDISSIIDPRLSQVVLGKPFVEVSNMTCDLSEGVVKFTDETNEIAYKMPHKIE